MDRYLPAPEILGAGLLSFALVRPYADRAARLVADSVADPCTFLVWAGEAAVLVVFGSVNQAQAERVRARLGDPIAGHLDLLLSIDLREQSVPIFFDFEGAWVRCAGLIASTAYPQGLPRIQRSNLPGGEVKLSENELRALAALLESPRHSLSSVRSIVGQPSASGSLAERRIIQRGWVQPRSFLNPRAVARTIDGFPSHLVFVHGRWKNGAKGPELQYELQSACGVSPFLFVSSEQAALIGMLAVGTGTSLTARGVGRPAVLETLQRFLERIEVLREPLARLNSSVEHRYARLLAH